MAAGFYCSNESEGNLMSWRGSDSDGGWARSAAARARRGVRGAVADVLAVAALAGVLALLWWF